MALIECPECGKETSSTAAIVECLYIALAPLVQQMKKCLHCGFKWEVVRLTQIQKTLLVFLWIAFFIAVILVLDWLGILGISDYQGPTQYHITSNL